VEVELEHQGQVQHLLHVIKEILEQFQVLVQFLLLEAEEAVVPVLQVLWLVVKQEVQAVEEDITVEQVEQEIVPLLLVHKEILEVIAHQVLLILVRFLVAEAVIRLREPMARLVRDQVVVELEPFVELEELLLIP